MNTLIAVIETARDNAIDQKWFAFEPAIQGKAIGNGAYALITGVFADDLDSAKTVA